MLVEFLQGKEFIVRVSFRSIFADTANGNGWLRLILYSQEVGNEACFLDYGLKG